MTTDELKAVPLLTGVSDAGLERIAACASTIEYQPGQVMALEGDPGSGMFVIVDGTASVEMRGGFHTELHAGNFFGEVALLVPDANRVARVVAATDIRCLTIPRADFLELVESEPSLALAMLRELARRLSNA